MQSNDPSPTSSPSQGRRAIEGALTRDRGRLLGLLSKWQARPKDEALRDAFRYSCCCEHDCCGHTRSHQGRQGVDLPGLARHLAQNVGLLRAGSGGICSVDGRLAIIHRTRNLQRDEVQALEPLRIESWLQRDGVGTIGTRFGRRGLRGIAETVPVEVQAHHGVLDRCIQHHMARQGGWERRRGRRHLGGTVAATTSSQPQGGNGRQGEREGGTNLQCHGSSLE